MEILSGRDGRILAIMNAAQAVGREEFQMLFERKIYCDLFNRYPFPENAVYRLRAEKLPNYRERYFREAIQLEKLRAFEALKELLGNQVPEVIANFRILRSAHVDGIVTLCNSMGEQSDLREADYFDVASGITLRSRCLKLGNYYWTGSQRLVRPFVEDCLRDQLLASPSTGS